MSAQDKEAANSGSLSAELVHQLTYEGQSSSAALYTALKVIEISAAAIPVLAATGGDSFMTRGWIARLGALVVVLEGIQQLKKYARNALLWVKGRSLEA